MFVGCPPSECATPHRPPNGNVRTAPGKRNFVVVCNTYVYLYSKQAEVSRKVSTVISLKIKPWFAVQIKSVFILLILFYCSVWLVYGFGPLVLSPPGASIHVLVALMRRDYFGGISVLLSYETLPRWAELMTEAQLLLTPVRHVSRCSGR